MTSPSAVMATTERLFRERFGSDGDLHLGWSPGRVNLIGEYTDLSNGFVLPMAIDLGLCVVLRSRQKPGLSLFATAFDEAVELSHMSADLTDIPGWARYLLGVVVLSREAGLSADGYDIVVNADMPLAGGVSSSAALTTATAMAVQSALASPLTPEASAQLCQAVEHRFAGVRCGIMDQMACRLGAPDSALFLDCASLAHHHLPMPRESAEILIVGSGVSRSLSESAYNQRRAECEEALAIIQQDGTRASDLRDVSAETLLRIEARLPVPLNQRVRHIVHENARVVAAHNALSQGAYVEFGALMNQSHESLRDDFEVSIGELDHIVATANRCVGVFGARLTGAGFGGNAIVLTQPGLTEDVMVKIANGFEQRFGRKPWMHRVQAATSAAGFPVLSPRTPSV